MVHYVESANPQDKVTMCFGEEFGSFFGTTGIKTLDMLLSSFCRFGNIELTLESENVDDLSAQRIAILVANCMREAFCDVGEGVVFSCEHPYGESLSKCVVDMSDDALSAFVFECELSEDKSFVKEFLETFVLTMGKTVHIYATKNGGDRRRLEAVFRSLGVAFGECLKKRDDFD